jgi:hypothetical protein
MDPGPICFSSRGLGELMKTHAIRFLRSVAGIVVGTIVAIVGFSLFAGFPDAGAPDPVYLTPFLVFGIIFGLMFTIPLGLLGHSVLYALKWRNGFAYVLVGGFASVSYALAVAVTNNMISPGTLATYGVMGITCAAIAWLIRRPDLDPAP